MRFLYCLLQVTWGIIQNFIGFGIFLFNINNPHYFYHGAIITDWKHKSSCGCGMFIFMGTPNTRENRRYYKEILIHEYGHTIQSCILGPLFIPLIALPSIIWCNVPCFIEMREKKSVSYYKPYFERTASILGSEYHKRFIQKGKA